MANFQNSSIKVQYRTAIDDFVWISCRSVPLQRNASSLFPLRKIHTLFTVILCPFGPGRKSFNTWDLSSPTCACKILSGSIKVCRSYSRTADFEQIHIMLPCICMTAYSRHFTVYHCKLNLAFLQSAKLQLANWLQNCYFCLIQKTTSNSLLWPLVINCFWSGSFAPACLLRPGATAPPLSPPSYATAQYTSVSKRL